MSKRHLAVLVLAATAVAVSDCGNSTKTESAVVPTRTQTQATTTAAPTTAVLTRKQLIAKANAICARLTANLAATNTTVGRVQDIGQVTPQVASIQRAALAELTRLVPPATLASDWQQVLLDTHTIAANTVRLGEYAQRNELKNLNALVDANKAVERRVIHTTRHDGFTHCANAI